MAQLANGWQVIECREPDDVFKHTTLLSNKYSWLTMHLEDRVQRNQGSEVGIRPRQDYSGWTAATGLFGQAGKHILERAVLEMDLQGKARDYPKPAEVLVQADNLSVREKALILYRHSANEGLEDDAKTILKLTFQRS